MENVFPPLKNDLILRVIRGEKVERIPIWIMRQAGRYLPEFQEIRKRHDFFHIVQTPELCSEITLQPILRYNFDAAIIFSDILIVCQAMGMRVDMVEGKGPVFDSPLNTPEDFRRLNMEVDINKSIGYLLKAINLTRIRLDGRCPLIGFCGAPWTLMCYMTDSSKNTGAKNYSASRKWLYKYPTDSIYLLDKIATVVANLLVEQAKAGAQLLMLFESHAELLNHSLYTRFIMKSLTKITTIVKESCNVPMIYFAKGGHYLINDLLESSFDVIGIDWTLDPAHIKVSDKTLMGNLDPAALYGDDDHIVSEVEKILEKFKGHRHIFNLGHGIYPDTDHKAVKTLVAKLRDYKI